MRLAFEAALAKLDVDSTTLENAPPEQMTAAWSGPRDRA